jgi:hypothetical protein
MLARDPERRFPTAAEVAAALEPFADESHLDELILQMRQSPSAQEPTAEASIAKTDPYRSSALADTRPSRLHGGEAGRAPKRRRWKPRVIALALAAAASLLAAGILIHVATDTGDVVIDASASGVELSIRRNGREINRVLVGQDGKRLKLWSGDYEIVVVGTGADGVHIENGKFTLTRDGEQIVSVWRDSTRGPISTVSDPEDNLVGDASRRYMDIVEASAGLQGDDCVFGVVVAAPLPAPAEMSGGKRVDFRFAIDADRDATTGMSRLGAEYLLFIVLEDEGWRGTFSEVDEDRRPRPLRTAEQAMKVTARDGSVSIAFPRRHLPANVFDWTVSSNSGNSDGWLPKTSNPPTRRMTFEATSPGPSKDTSP